MNGEAHITEPTQAGGAPVLGGTDGAGDGEWEDADPALSVYEQVQQLKKSMHPAERKRRKAELDKRTEAARSVLERGLIKSPEEAADLLMAVVWPSAEVLAAQKEAA